MLRSFSRRPLLALAGLVTSVAWPAAAQDTTEIARLRRQIEAITRQLEAMQLGQEVVRADTSVAGFGPAAAKVYRVRQGVSLGGYGEVLYENFAGEREDGAPSERTDQLDALRGIVYVGYKFDDRLLFNSEIEFEHASTDQGGSVSLEFAYVDYRLSDAFGVRAGLLLAPMGFLNELHEPPIFLGTTRPATEQQLIPSTWRENGIGVFGQFGDVAYRAYLMNGFDAVGGGTSNASGFSASGLRGGRQKGSRVVAEDFSGVARADYTGVLGFVLGGSVYLGNSGQGRSLPSDATQTIGARTTIWEGHAEYRARGFDLRALFAVANVDDVAALNATRGLTGAASIGERLVGWYVQGGYNVLRSVQTEHQLVPYVRYERLNTQDRVPDGIGEDGLPFTPDPANDRTILAIGAAWKPIINVVLKADYQLHSNDAVSGVDQFNVALGYLF